jgi:hypothetical protein
MKWIRGLTGSNLRRTRMESSQSQRDAVPNLPEIKSAGLSPIFTSSNPAST